MPVSPSLACFCRGGVGVKTDRETDIYLCVQVYSESETALRAQVVFPLLSVHSPLFCLSLFLRLFYFLYLSPAGFVLHQCVCDGWEEGGWKLFYMLYFSILFAYCILYLLSFTLFLFSFGVILLYMQSNYACKVL